MLPITLTLKTLRYTKIISLMIICAILAVAVVLSLVALFTWIASYLVNFETGWINTLFTWMIGIISGIGGWFMLPALVVLTAGIFQEKVIYRVEQFHYSNSSHNESPKFWPDFLYDIKFTLKAVFLNLLVLPLYLIGIGFIVSIIINSYLLGREFFESAAGYHLGKIKARELGNQNRTIIYVG